MEFTNYNQSVRQWGGQALTGIKTTGRSYGITHRSNSPSRTDSVAAMKDKYKEKQGAVNVISFTLNRPLIYAMVGAGRGQGGLKGSRWINAKGISRRTNPASLNKQDSGNRKAKPYVDAYLDSPNGVNLLGDIVAEELGDAIVGEIKFK
jgi:hypothetical protein